MGLYFVHSMRRIPVEDRERRIRRLLMDLPIYLAGGLGATLMLVGCTLALKEDFQASPDGWLGAVTLAAILLSASVIVVLACAAAGAVVGCVLQRLFASRPSGHLTASGGR